jgi:hypothetical protein
MRVRFFITGMFVGSVVGFIILLLGFKGIVTIVVCGFVNKTGKYSLECIFCVTEMLFNIEVF